MARGQQKLQSQAKAAEKAAKVAKQKGHNANTQKKAAQQALVFSCAVCKAQMPDPKTYKQHFENKHPKNDLPPELKNEWKAFQSSWYNLEGGKKTQLFFFLSLSEKGKWRFLINHLQRNPWY